MSGLLLDSHAVIWLLDGNPKLGPMARTAIAAEDVAVHVSAVSPWEMQIKAAAHGSLLADDVLDRMDAVGLTPLPITSHDGIRAGALPRHHRDPFDRMLVAQCLHHDLTLVTVDRMMRHYDIRILPAAA